MPLHHHLHKKIEHKHTTMALALALALATSFLNLAAMPFGSAQAQSTDSNTTAPAVQPDTTQPQPPVHEPAPQPAPAPESQPAQPQEQPRSEQGHGGEGVPQGEDNEREEQPVDPRELKNALQQIRQLRLEIRSLLRQLAQMKDATNREEDMAALKALDARAVELGTGISKEKTREALQEFYEARLWDEVQLFRAKIQLPRDLKDIARALTKVDRLLKAKTIIKAGLDVSKLRVCYDQIKSVHTEATNFYQAGNLEDAQESLQELHQGGMHPGGFEGALHRMRGVKDLLRPIKDKEIRAAIEELLAPVYEALYECDFNEVHNILGEYEDDLRRLVNFITRSRSKFGKVESRISDLEDLIRAKSDALDAQQQNKGGGGGEQTAPTQ